MQPSRLPPTVHALSDFYLRIHYDTVLRERDLLRADIQHWRSTNGALHAQNEDLEAEKQHLLIELDKVVNSYADLQYHQFLRDEEEPSRQRAMSELLSVKDKALAEVERLQQALVTYDSNLANIQADNKATHAALEAMKAQVSAARMHETLPHNSLRALMLQRTEAWTAERAAMRKECDELREFKERMQQEVCCEVCYDAVASHPLPNCSHRLCKCCLEKVDSCPFCRASVQDENQPPAVQSMTRHTLSTGRRTPFASRNSSPLPSSAVFMPRALIFTTPAHANFLTQSSSPMN